MNISDTNPHSNATSTSRSEVEYAFLRRGTISSVEQQQNGAGFHATVQEAGIAADRPIPIIPGVHGDLYVPPEGAPVAVAPFNQNDYAIIGSPVPPVSTPTLDPGERVISHPVSGANVYFNKDGSIDIKGDAEIRINGGDQGVITDVQAGGTNSDGGITSLDITREDSIKV